MASNHLKISEIHSLKDIICNPNIWAKLENKQRDQALGLIHKFGDFDMIKMVEVNPYTPEMSRDERILHQVSLLKEIEELARACLISGQEMGMKETTSLQKAIKRVDELRSGLQPAKPHSEEAPDLNLMARFIEESPEGLESGESWLMAESKHNAKKNHATAKNKAKKAFLPISFGTAVSVMSGESRIDDDHQGPEIEDAESVKEGKKPERESDDAKNSVPLGEGVFPSKTKNIALIYVPGARRLMLSGKPVAAAQVKRVLAEGLGKWEEYEPPCYWKSDTLDQNAVQALRDRWFIHKHLYPVMMACATQVDCLPARLTPAEMEMSQWQKHMKLARCSYYICQAERHLTQSGWDSKVNFALIWGSRVANVPDSLDPEPVLEKFSFILKKETGKEDKKMCRINRTFHSFITGNLASWKKTETRTNFLDRSKKAFEFWWGSQTTAYLSEVMQLESFKSESRPTFTQGAYKSFGKKFVAAKSAAVAGTSFAKAAAANILTPKSEEDDEEEGVRTTPVTKTWGSFFELKREALRLILTKTVGYVSGVVQVTEDDDWEYRQSFGDLAKKLVLAPLALPIRLYYGIRYSSSPYPNIEDATDDQFVKRNWLNLLFAPWMALKKAKKSLGIFFNGMYNYFKSEADESDTED